MNSKGLLPCEGRDRPTQQKLRTSEGETGCCCRWTADRAAAGEQRHRRLHGGERTAPEGERAASPPPHPQLRSTTRLVSQLCLRENMSQWNNALEEALGQRGEHSSKDLFTERRLAGPHFSFSHRSALNTGFNTCLSLLLQSSRCALLLPCVSSVGLHVTGTALLVVPCHSIGTISQYLT